MDQRTEVKNLDKQLKIINKAKTSYYGVQKFCRKKLEMQPKNTALNVQSDNELEHHLWDSSLEKRTTLTNARINFCVEQLICITAAFRIFPTAIIEAVFDLIPLHIVAENNYTKSDQGRNDQAYAS